MSEELKTILDKLEIVARKHTIEVCEDGSKIETMSANVDELRLNNYSAKLLLNYIQQKENIIKEVREIANKNISFDSEYPGYMTMLSEDYYELLEILDKENK